MIWVTLFYDTCMLSTLLYAFWRGGSDERWGAAINVVASVVSWMIAPAKGTGFHQPELLMWSVDVAAAAAYMLLMLVSRRRWPIWAAACAIDGAMVTAARLLVTDTHYKTYFANEAIWPVGIMLAIVFGTALTDRHPARSTH